MAYPDAAIRALDAAPCRWVKGKFPLIGVGGIDGPQDAYAKLEASATLLQLYSPLIFEGPGLVLRI